jgi:hypothetical protein
LVEAVVATAAGGAAAIALVQPLEQQSYVPAAASKPRFLLNLAEIVRYFAATASRRKRAVRAAAVADVDAAVMTVADAAAVAADATNSPY